MHTFWLVLLVPGLAMLAMTNNVWRGTNIYSLGFWLALVSSFAFFGYDVFAYMDQLNSAKDIGLRLVWKFLISNGIPLIQLTTAFGVGWLLATRSTRLAAESEDIMPTESSQPISS